jgi:predicted Zn-dependent protease
MKARGVTSIDVTENVVMTDLALERAMRYEMKINRIEQSAPKATYSPSVNLTASTVHTTVSRNSNHAELRQRIKSAVLARLDGRVDDALLEAVITRVLEEMK